jgi:CheY-like chemotaxis protein/predicted Ser/Thr protein kinase
MPDLDAQSLSDQAVMLGLITRPQARDAALDADDGSLEALTRAFLRKGMLTSWQLDRLQKNDPTGFFFGGCKVLFHLAEGTFARVYRGVRGDDGLPVAIKVLRNRFVQDPGAVDRFQKEAEAGMKLEHPNIVKILDFGEQERRYYIIMEYVEGLNLREFLKLRAKLTPEESLPMMIGLVKALKYSNERGVTHRDIKGTNILISNAGEAKLVDFGLAGIEGDDKKSSMQSQRTVDYSALERTCGAEKGDPRSDIFFLGCVFYQMLTGQAAMKESESKDMLQKMLVRSFYSIIPLSEHRLAPDPELAAVIEKMMKVELKARYQSMDQVLADLERYRQRAETGITGMEAPPEDDSEFLGDLDDVFAQQQYSDSGRPTSAGQAETKTAVRKTVLCVETQNEIQDAFRRSLQKMGYRFVLVTDAELAAERYREAPFDAVVIDFDGLGPEALDAFIDMKDKADLDSKPLVALALLGPRQRDLLEKLPTGERLMVLAKPVKMKQVTSAIKKILPLH